MQYNTQGVCASNIHFDIENGKLTNVKFIGGCPGNLKAIEILLEGMPIEEVVTKLKGITCGNKTTSCTDQLSLAIEEYLKNK